MVTCISSDVWNIGILGIRLQSADKFWHFQLSSVPAISSVINRLHQINISISLSRLFFCYNGNFLFPLNQFSESFVTRLPFIFITWVPLKQNTNTICIILDNLSSVERWPSVPIPLCSTGMQHSATYRSFIKMQQIGVCVNKWFGGSLRTYFDAFRHASFNLQMSLFALCLCWTRCAFMQTVANKKVGFMMSDQCFFYILSI